MDGFIRFFKNNKFQLFKTIESDGILPNASYEANVTFIPKLEKDKTEIEL